MSIKPRTIDNLGLESSVRYAKDMELLDQKLVQDSWIAQRTEISVVKPYIPSEFEQLFSPGKSILWATFMAPPEYLSSTKPLFSYQLIPSLGGSEKQDIDLEKLASLEDVLKKPNSRKKRDPFPDSDPQRDPQKEEAERQILMDLLKTIQKLDKTLTLINSRRNQYQRG
jgi:hypothetical protein